MAAILTGESELTKGLDLSAFIHSVESLSQVTEKQKAELRNNEKKLAEIKAIQKRSSALLDGLQGLFDVRNLKIEHGDVEGIRIHLTVGQCDCTLVLDCTNKLTNIEVHGGGGEHMVETSAILSAATRLAPPNDIRQAVFHLGATQSMKQALKEHITEQRQKYIVSVQGPYNIKLSLQNGVSVSLKVHPCYPLVPGGVYVEEVVDGGDNFLRHGQAPSALQDACNARCFYTLAQVCQYIDDFMAKLA